MDESTAREARTWAQKAVEIDPRSGLSWAALVGAAIFEAEPQTDVVLSHALRAALYGERCSECQSALSDALAGSAFTLSLAALEMAHRLDPLTLIYGGNYAFSLMMLGRPSEALSAIADTRALEPDEPWTLLQETFILASVGRLAQAQDHLKALERATREKRLNPSAYLSVRAAVAIAAGSAERAEHLKAVRALVADPMRSQWDRLMHQMIIVPFLVQRGDGGTALDLLESGAAENVVVPFDWLMLDSRLAPVRSDVRFVRLARSAKVRSDLNRAVLRQADMRGELPPYLREPLRQLDTLTSQFTTVTR